jgi:hypothetical protein
MYNLLKQLENGEFVTVDTLDELDETVKLARGLKTTWSGRYVVRDPKGNDVELPEITVV